MRVGTIFTFVGSVSLGAGVVLVLHGVGVSPMVITGVILLILGVVLMLEARDRP